MKNDSKKFMFAMFMLVILAIAGALYQESLGWKNEWVKPNGTSQETKTDWIKKHPNVTIVEYGNYHSFGRGYEGAIVVYK